MSQSRIGIWLIGVRGGVASTAILGLESLKRRGTDRVGLVSELPQFADAGLPDWNVFVVGGHEIRRTPLFEGVQRWVEEFRHIRPETLADSRKEIEAIDARIRPGTLAGCGPTVAGLADWEIPADPTPRHTIDRLRNDMREFASTNRLDHVIAVNVSSTEPTVAVDSIPKTWSELDRELEAGGGEILPASSLYAIAALGAGYSFINFTPSLGASPSAIGELARLRETRHYGCDGKTGETLMKSVLAPLFADRNLRVLSWVGHNIFGNMDAVALNDPANKQTKVASKDHLIREILGYKPDTLVSIEYLQDLGDWKTAWDHIHFQGFLGVPMTLQFTWQGCDSILAAPLVLDLARFTELARRRNVVGSMPFLSSFFKSPYDTTEHNFERQFQTLEAWATGK